MHRLEEINLCQAFWCSECDSKANDQN